MITVYECRYCEIGVEYSTEDTQEHNEFECCQACLEDENQ
jgi:hypothetical protein